MPQNPFPGSFFVNTLPAFSLPFTNGTDSFRKHRRLQAAIFAGNDPMTVQRIKSRCEFSFCIASKRELCFIAVSIRKRRRCNWSNQFWIKSGYSLNRIPNTLFLSPAFCCIGDMPENTSTALCKLWAIRFHPIF